MSNKEDATPMHFCFCKGHRDRFLRYINIKVKRSRWGRDTEIVRNGKIDVRSDMDDVVYRVIVRTARGWRRHGCCYNRWDLDIVRLYGFFFKGNGTENISKRGGKVMQS